MPKKPFVILRWYLNESKARDTVNFGSRDKFCLKFPDRIILLAFVTVCGTNTLYLLTCFLLFVLQLIFFAANTNCWIQRSIKGPKGHASCWCACYRRPKVTGTNRLGEKGSNKKLLVLPVGGLEHWVCNLIPGKEFEPLGTSLGKKVDIFKTTYGNEKDDENWSIYRIRLEILIKIKKHNLGVVIWNKEERNRKWKPYAHFWSGVNKS